MERPKPLSVEEVRKLYGWGGKKPSPSYKRPTSENITKRELKLLPSASEAKVLGMLGYTPDMSIYIPGQVYSSKNTHTVSIRSYQGAGKPRYFVNYGKGFEPVTLGVRKNRAASLYAITAAQRYEENTSRFKEMVKDLRPPYRISFTFIMANRGKWDFHNMVQGVADAMVAAKWLDDDDKETLLPYPPAPDKPVWLLDKNSVGVVITVLQDLHGGFHPFELVE